MFTGIITDIGTIAKVTQSGDTRFDVLTAYDTDTIDLGASISHSGVCLTVVEKARALTAIGLRLRPRKKRWILLLPINGKKAQGSIWSAR